MDLRNLDVKNINNLDEYDTIFGDIKFYESQNLSINSYTSFPDQTI